MHEEIFKTMHYVNTGEVNSGLRDVIFSSGAIGSCVVITAFDPEKNCGGMAHVMLPGNSPQKRNSVHTRYAANAVEELLRQLKRLGSRKENLKVCLLGGANVLKRENDNIGNDNIASIEILLDNLGIKVCAKSVGGTERRTALFNIESGRVYFTIGDAKESLLWEFEV